MSKLYCAMCKTNKDDKEFTSFKRNPSLKDRNGNCPICKDCASKYVEERGNTKEALKEVLRLQDIPYVEKYADMALDTFKKKRQNTNIVIKRNVYDEGEEVQGIETITLQNTIYTCYSARLGIMPKKYINFTFSDGLRNDEIEQEPTNNNKSDNDEKEVKSAVRYLVKLFTKSIFDDKKKLSKAVKLYFDEVDLHKNNTNKRQQKFKLKNHIIALVNAEVLNKEDYPFIFEEEGSDKPSDIMIIDNQPTNQEVSIPEGMDMENLKVKWGSEYKEYDIVKFENKYQELRRNYEIKTASHDEFLKLACVSSVRATECMARNLVDEAKTWLTMFKDMTSAGKLQPQQMSKADLSGGLSNFGEFYKSIEQAKSVIEILPEFKKQPKDDADFVIYCLIQYVRRLKGLPDVKYQDIWAFYDELAQSFEEDDDKSDIVDELLAELPEEGDEDGE